MSDKNREVLSRLMDGEWDDLDPSRCVADACASKEQQAVWARYHLARDAMRGDSVDETFSIASAVSAAIADEPTYSNVTEISAFEAKSASHGTSQASASAEPVANKASGKSSASRWGLGAAGFGIAASAALATVVGLDYFRNHSHNEVPQTLVAGTGSTPAAVQNLPRIAIQQPRVDLVSNRGSYWVSSQNGQRVGAETRLNQLLGDHIEHSPVGDWNGMLPYSRLVGYDASVGSD